MEYKIYVPTRYMTNKGRESFIENNFQNIVDSLCIKLRVNYEIDRIYVRK